MAAADKTYVLVTGGNTGIGYEICMKLASKQTNYHILMDTRSLQKGSEAVSACDVGEGRSQWGFFERRGHCAFLVSSGEIGSLQAQVELAAA